MYLLAAMAILGIIWLTIKYMARADPKNIKKTMRNVGGAFAIFLSLILTLKGALPIAIPVFLFGLGILGLGHLAGIELPWASSRKITKSKIQTRILSVDLDHSDGKIQGTVISGQFNGQSLSQLNQTQLLDLLEECFAAGDQSPQLLQAYLDTTHPQWRQNYHGDTASTGPGYNNNAAMDEAEALAVLGLNNGASKKQIITAHRKLMKQYHPDHGGSDYLAAKINQAKDFLLG